jgi:hypothetical protein
VSEHPHKDNWLSVARLRAEAEAGAPAENTSGDARKLLFDEDHHAF